MSLSASRHPSAGRRPVGPSHRSCATALPVALAAGLLVVLAAAPLRAAEARFEDYPVAMDEPRPGVRLDVSDPDARSFRTRLRAALKEGVNFAGRYALATWGCGTSCEMAGYVDVTTGKARLVPVSVCCADIDGDRIRFRPDSRLLVLDGMLNEEEPDGVHLFVVEEDGTLRKVGVEGR